MILDPTDSGEGGSTACPPNPLTGGVGGLTINANQGLSPYQGSYCYCLIIHGLHP